MVSEMRLDKFLSLYGGLSRKEAKTAVKKGRVTVEGETAVKPEMKIQDSEVFLDGVKVEGQQHVYYMMNKPSGVLSATKDAGKKTVVDLMDTRGREIFPVGRLDKDTEGLLLLTNNGLLAHRLLSPKYHVEKCYVLRYEGELQKEAAELFAKGMDIGEKRETKPAKLELLGDGKAMVTISEGKYHQVKRMIGKVGGRVTYLKRISMGTLKLDETLQPGEYRMLTEKEISELTTSERKEE